MNAFAVLVLVVSVVYIPLACALMVVGVSQAIRDYRASNTEEEKEKGAGALVGGLLFWPGTAVFIGMAGFQAWTDPTAIEAALRGGRGRLDVLLSFALIVIIGTSVLMVAQYVLKARKARRQQQSDAAIARRIQHRQPERFGDR